MERPLREVALLGPDSTWLDDADAARDDRAGEEAFEDMVLREEVQRCPHCHCPTIRHGGCRQMLCAQCRRTWVWNVDGMGGAGGRRGVGTLWADNVMEHAAQSLHDSLEGALVL